MTDFKELSKRIKGAIVVMITPFRDNYEIDKDGVKRLTRFLIESGIKEGTGALIPAASYGESPMLTAEEQSAIFKIVKKEAANEVPVIGGCIHTDTRTVIKLVKYAEEAGLDAVMVTPPYYWKPTEKVVLTHFSAVAEKTNLGIIAYNNCFATQMEMTVEIMVKLVNNIPNIIAIKDSTSRVEKFTETVNALGEKVSVLNGYFAGNEPEASIRGAKGFICGEINVLPKDFINIYKAEKERNFEKAKKIIKEITPISDFINGGDGPENIVRIKAIMNKLGLPGGIPRLPLLPIDITLQKELSKTVRIIKERASDL